MFLNYVKQNPKRTSNAIIAAHFGIYRFGIISFMFKSKNVGQLRFMKWFIIKVLLFLTFFYIRLILFHPLLDIGFFQISPCATF